MSLVLIDLPKAKILLMRQILLSRSHSFDVKRMTSIDQSRRSSSSRLDGEVSVA